MNTTIDPDAVDSAYVTTTEDLQDLPGQAMGDRPAPAGSDLQLLTRAVAAKIAKPVYFEIPDYPEFFLRFRTNVKAAEIEKWNKQATKGKDFDACFAAQLVLCNTVVEILQGDRTLCDAAGDPLTFVNKELMASLECLTAAQAVKRFIGRDGDIIALGNAAIEASGFGKEMQAATDPTVVVSSQD